MKPLTNLVIGTTAAAMLWTACQDAHVLNTDKKNDNSSPAPDPISLPTPKADAGVKDPPKPTVNLDAGVANTPAKDAGSARRDGGNRPDLTLQLPTGGLDPSSLGNLGGSMPDLSSIPGLGSIPGIGSLTGNGGSLDPNALSGLTGLAGGGGGSLDPNALSGLTGLAGGGGGGSLDPNSIPGFGDLLKNIPGGGSMPDLSSLTGGGGGGMGDLLKNIPGGGSLPGLDTLGGSVTKNDAGP